MLRYILTAALWVALAPCFGQSFPNRPVRFVTGSTGSGSDIVARLIAQHVSGPLGQQVLADNIPGVQVHTVDGEVFWRKDGTPFWVEYTSTPIHDRRQIDLRGKAIPQALEFTG